MSEIPDSWYSAKIVDVLSLNDNRKPFQQGWSPQCESYPSEEGEWGVLKTTAIQQGEFWSHENKALPKALEPRPHLEVKPGDILMTCAGPRNRCGVVCFVKETRSKLLMSGKMYRFRPDLEILIPKYLEAFIISHDAQRAIDRMKTGINDSGLNLTHGRFAELEVPLAPVNEQHRIVAKIEELFSELDKGIESLKTAREQLKIYRQAVLKHAFEGKLTAQWREKHKDKLESPEQLLARIQPDDSFLKIPTSWHCLNVKDLVTKGPSNGRSVKDRANGFPVLRLTALKGGKIDLTERKFGDWDRDSAKPFIVKAGDFLLSRGNGSKHLVGRGGIVPTYEDEVAFPDTMVRLQIDQDSMLIEFFSLVWESRILRDQIEKAARTTAGIYKINQRHIENFLIPVPSIPEQKVIISKLAEKLSVIDNVEEEITKRLITAETLWQSILKKAFSGQLVPQDPNDEPAAVLLERIRTAKATQPKAAKSPRRGRATRSER